jgi:hypothetical protein
MTWSGEVEPIVLAVLLLGFFPALLAGMIGRHLLGRDSSRIVATAFAWPMFGWGIGMLFETDGWGMMVWSGIGAAMLAAAVLGTYVTDRLKRLATSS